MLGWTYKEIADIMGLKIPGVQSIYEKFNIKEIINSYPNKPIEELAAYHKLDEATTWAIVLQDKTDLERFKLLDWTEQEIADAVISAGYEKTYGQPSVNAKLSEFPELEKLIKLQFNDGKGSSIPNIVKSIEENFPIDEPTTWAVVLEGKTDLERFKLLDIKAKVYDVWNFSGCNKLLGSKSDSRACQFGRHNSKVSFIEP